MMASSDGLQKALFRILFIYVSLATIIGGTQGQTPCAANTLPPTNLDLAVNITGKNCFMLDVTYDAGGSTTHTFWYERDISTNGATTLTVLLKVLKQSPPVWYGMGFNADYDQMPGTNAIIFYLNTTSQKPVISTNHLTGTLISDVVPDNTALTYTTPPQVTSTSDSLYLAFDVDNANSSSFTYENFPVGEPNDFPPSKQHQGVLSVHINFESKTITVTTNDVSTKARNHGILNIIGWGVLLPGGAITARYFRSFDPHWFYGHAVLQILGYVFIIVGLATGFSLYDDVHKGNPELNVDTHRALGILIFVFATIQMTAILLRPKKEAKLRRYWNWQHWWLGRIALVVAAVNIFVGIHLGQAGHSWKVGYGVVLGLELLLVVVLEALLWIKFARTRNEPAFPQTAMQNRVPANGVAPMSTPSQYASPTWDDK